MDTTNGVTRNCSYYITATEFKINIEILANCKIVIIICIF